MSQSTMIRLSSDAYRMRDQFRLADVAPKLRDLARRVGMTELRAARALEELGESGFGFLELDGNGDHVFKVLKEQNAFKVVSLDDPPPLLDYDNYTRWRLVWALMFIGWSQGQLGRELRCHESTVRQWVNGKHAIPTNLAHWIEQAVVARRLLGLPEGWKLSRDDQDEAHERIERRRAVKFGDEAA